MSEACEHSWGQDSAGGLVCSQCWESFPPASTQGEAQREAGNQPSRERSPSTRAAPPPVLADHGGSESATAQAEAADYRARLYAAERERGELRDALGKLANEAAGFLSMASPETHGITNMRVLEGRIAEARALLTPKEPG